MCANNSIDDNIYPIKPQNPPVSPLKLVPIKFIQVDTMHSIPDFGDGGRNSIAEGIVREGL